MKDIAKEIIDKTIENIDSPADVINKVIGALGDKVNKQNAILTELEEWLKEQGKNGIDEWGNHYTVCLYKLNKLKEKYK